MGDPRRQHKKFARPKKTFSKARIEEERAIVKSYGLKNQREVWKAETAIDRIRAQAKKLIVNPEGQETFFNRLRKIGLIKGQVTIDDILSLTKEKLLERRLQTIVMKKGIAKTAKAARQLITHRKIKVRGHVIDVPSYIVKVDEEDSIEIRAKVKKEKPAEKIENKEEPSIGE